MSPIIEHDFQIIKSVTYFYTWSHLESFSYCGICTIRYWTATTPRTTGTILAIPVLSYDCTFSAKGLNIYDYEFKEIKILLIQGVWIYFFFVFVQTLVCALWLTAFVTLSNSLYSHSRIQAAAVFWLDCCYGQSNRLISVNIYKDCISVSHAQDRLTEHTNYEWVYSNSNFPGRKGGSPIISSSNLAIE